MGQIDVADAMTSSTDISAQSSPSALRCGKLCADVAVDAASITVLRLLATRRISFWRNSCDRLDSAAAASRNCSGTLGPSKLPRRSCFAARCCCCSVRSDISMVGCRRRSALCASGALQHGPAHSLRRPLFTVSLHKACRRSDGVAERRSLDLLECKVCIVDPWSGRAWRGRSRRW